jgi:hypothetical protein
MKAEHEGGPDTNITSRRARSRLSVVTSTRERLKEAVPPVLWPRN